MNKIFVEGKETKMDEPEKKVKQAVTSEPPAEPPPRQSEEPSESVKNDEDFDFGGLPQRDLKKNLGCG